MRQVRIKSSLSEISIISCTNNFNEEAINNLTLASSHFYKTKFKSELKNKNTLCNLYLNYNRNLNKLLVIGNYLVDISNLKIVLKFEPRKTAVNKSIIRNYPELYNALTLPEANRDIDDSESVSLDILFIDLGNNVSKLNDKFLECFREKSFEKYIKKIGYEFTK